MFVWTVRNILGFQVPVPTRFVFVLLGPQGHGNQYREIGRAIATLMSDEVKRMLKNFKHIF